MIQVSGTRLREQLHHEILAELTQWAKKHPFNLRPSIAAKAYMILRTPAEFSIKNSNKARKAARKIKKYNRLWSLACTAISEVDPTFAKSFSALAVTYGFV